VIEELLEVIDYSDSDTSDDADLDAPAEASLMAVSAPSAVVQHKRRTMQFQGYIGKQEVLILVDSGSVCSFLSAQMASQIQCPAFPIQAEKFAVADGAQCSVILWLRTCNGGHRVSHSHKICASLIWVALISFWEQTGWKATVPCGSIGGKEDEIFL
jgi:hypothetical protein